MIIEALRPLAVPIGDVSPDPANARTGHDIDGIAASLRAYGQRKPIVANRSTGIVLAGNGTLEAARRLGWAEIAVSYVDDDPVTATAYAIADNRLADKSRFDEDILRDLLASLPSDYEVPGVDEDFWSSLSEPEIKHEKEENYTRKVKAPIYEPTRKDKPKIAELVDDSKYKALVKKIDGSFIDDKDKEFLRLAAARFIEFTYKNIAEYYAHSEKDVQELMEELALVIIDFEKAIELSFVKLTGEIAEEYKQEYGND
jgi:ParB-like chromosome segregation protein Spo0J